MVLKIETYIEAPIEVVFNLGRSLDLHKEVNSNHNEQIVQGRESGLVMQGDVITWQAKHFGFIQHLKVIVDEMKEPYVFHDKMLSGAFKFMEHTHRFDRYKKGTLMTDHFVFSSPLGFIGKMVDRWFLGKYLTQFLKHKNKVIKEIAESGDWNKYIK